jgi:hypothetical protein
VVVSELGVPELLAAGADGCGVGSLVSGAGGTGTVTSRLWQEDALSRKNTKLASKSGKRGIGIVPVAGLETGGR